MANQKSKYTETLYVRVSVLSKEWSVRQVPERFASFSAYVDYLIKTDKRKKKIR
jgi:hypothetical protein